ncbi:MAG TPA: hypothetical protein VEL70_03175 [Candidatus Acidoferrum sp.]|nr:hypothetical protein [Candidatus Acidoferrum sp.]
MRNVQGVYRALVLQGGGSLGVYEAGAYKAISEELSVSPSQVLNFRDEKN